MAFESYDIKAMLLPVLFALVVVMAACYVQSSSQQDPVTIGHLRGSVYHILPEGGANLVASVGRDGILLVDTDLRRNSESIKDSLKAVRDVPIKVLVNTHFHPDHAGGNEAFSESALIVSHRKARISMQSAMDTYDGRYHWDPLPLKALPDITFDEEMVVHFNDEDIRLVHMPGGHTDNDIVVWFNKSRVLHLGDIFRHQCLPYLDIAAGGSVRGLIQNLKTLIREIPDDWIIVPGHGPVANKADLQEYYERFVDAVSHVEREIDQGKSLREVKRAGLPGFYDTYPPSGLEPDMWIEIVYISLNGDK